MISLYALKPEFQLRLQPIVDKLAELGVTPNAVTVGAILLSIAGGACITLQPAASWPLLLLPVVLLIRMALNAIDGLLARQHHLETRLGQLLNELGDVLADSALYLPLALIPGVPAEGIVLLCMLAIISEMTGVLALNMSGSRSYAGPMGKSDRALALGGLAFFIGIGVDSGMWTIVLVVVINVSLIVTIINRARDACGSGERDNNSLLKSPP